MHRENTIIQLTDKTSIFQAPYHSNIVPKTKKNDRWYMKNDF